MKHKLLTFLALMLTALGAQTVRAEETHLRIEFLAGEETFELALIGKITFSGNLMILYGNDGMQLGSTSTDLIDKIVFREEQTTAISDVQTSTIQVFPNPTQDALFIRGVEGQQTVRIFSLQGQILQSALTTNGEAILHVGNLPYGNYLLQVGAQVVKFIKE